MGSTAPPLTPAPWPPPLARSSSMKSGATLR